MSLFIHGWGIKRTTNAFDPTSIGSLSADRYWCPLWELKNTCVKTSVVKLDLL